MPGKSSFDERHPLALGAGCGTTTEMAHKWLTESDLIIALGTSLTRSPYGQKILPNKLIIHNTHKINLRNIRHTYCTVLIILQSMYYLHTI